MRLSTSSLSVMLLTVGCATVPQTSLENRILSYGCNDAVVVATITNGAYEPAQTESLLGQGWIPATLHVRKVIRGAGLPEVLPVKYLAHNFMREDQEFMLVLKHGDTGYEIATGQLMAVRPLLAGHCD